MTRPRLCHECGHPVSQHDDQHGCRAMTPLPFSGGQLVVCLCDLVPAEAASPAGAQAESEGA